MHGRSWQRRGHDPHSIALYAPELQILISADALWENGFGVVFPELEGENAFDDIRHTLDACSALPIRLVVPGHGAPFQDVQAALARAYRRLDGFVANPVHHARYAAKVLVKFHSLECEQPHFGFAKWMRQTPYIPAIRTRYFADRQFDEWIDELIRDLCRTGALVVRGDWVSEP